MKRKTLLVLVCLWALFSTVGCIDFCMIIPEWCVLGESQEWAETNPSRHGMSQATGRTGQSDVDAVLGTSDLIGTVEAADKLVQEGMANGDPAKIDQAIAARPDDWTYRVKRAALAIEKGDESTFTAQLTQANTVRAKNGASEGWFARNTISELTAAKARIKGQWVSPSQCATLHRGLSNQYLALSTETGEQRYYDKAQAAQQDMNACPAASP